MGATGERIRRGLRAVVRTDFVAAAAVGLQQRVLRARSWRSGCERGSGQSAPRGASSAQARSLLVVAAVLLLALVREPAAARRSHVHRHCAAGHVLRLRSAAAAESADRAIRRLGRAARSRRSSRRAGAGRHLDEPAARRPVDLGRRQDPALPARERIGRSAQRFEVALRAQGLRRRARAPAGLRLRVRHAGVRREARRRPSSTRTRWSPATRRSSRTSPSRIRSIRRASSSACGSRCSTASPTRSRRS